MLRYLACIMYLQRVSLIFINQRKELNDLYFLRSKKRVIDEMLMQSIDLRALEKLLEKKTCNCIND